jgi:NAD+ synthase (glutamine-hydrolysing)
MNKIRLALCQINPTVGDLDGNVRKIIRFLEDAGSFRPDIVVFPELAITGYPPEDLLLRPGFIKDNIEALNLIRDKVDDCIVIVGFVDRKDAIYNAAAVIHERKVQDVYHKIYLPNYGVFDEVRYFKPGGRLPVYRFGDVSFGINICEDIWHSNGPATDLAGAGAGFIVNINASPYHAGKSDLRQKMLSERASANNVAIVYLNAVGGQDELVFDGHSLVLGCDGGLIACGRLFEEDMLLLDLDMPTVASAVSGKSGTKEIKIPGLPKGGDGVQLPRRSPFEGISMEGEVCGALVMGTRDYIRKNGFTGVCIGLSGGVDSALVAAIAVEAVGRENVTGIFMPSPYTSIESREDVSALAENLGIRVIEEPINMVFEAYLDTLRPAFGPSPPDITEENLQARIRGNILMAFSNKFGWLVLTTGNKSEMSVGYATLYGDMAGGFAVIKDVPKTLVYKICKWLNSKRTIIPERIMTKAPTAELRPNQKDTDSLPPYDMLDPIIKAYVEEDKDLDEIADAGFDPETVKRIIRLVDLSEYKRRQSPPGVKITPRAFGRDRRFPITNRYGR